MLPNLIKFIVRLFMETFYPFEIEGIEKIPATGGVIFACNHLSNADPPTVECCVARVRPARFLTKKELFDTPVIGWTMRQIRAISIDRKKPGGDLSALRETLGALKEGCLVVMFPEGTRSKDGKPGKPQAGIGFIACKSGAQVVTAHLWGTENFPFSGRIKIKVGNVLKFENPNLHGDEARAAYEEISSRIMADILAIKE